MKGSTNPKTILVEWRTAMRLCGPERRFHGLLLACANVMLIGVMIWTSTKAYASELVRDNILLLSNSRRAIDQLQQNSPAIPWENVLFRNSTEAYLAGFGLSCWIDRRLDAGQSISVELPAGTLEECLHKIANAAGAEWGLIESVVVFAPPGKIASIEKAGVMLYDQLLQNSADSVPVELRPLQWSRLTTPAELLATISALWRVDVSFSLPHDLMAEGQLPACTLATQLTLLASGFGKQVACESEKFELRVLDVESKWQANYDVKELTPDALSRLTNRSTRAKLKPHERLLLVSGSTAEHRRLLARKTSLPRRERKTQSLDQRITGFEARDKPASEVIEYVAKGLNFQVQYASTISASSKQRLITLIVKDIRVEELLFRIGEAAEWSISLKKNVLEVAPKP